jgi:hypothetical protein
VRVVLTGIYVVLVLAAAAPAAAEPPVSAISQYVEAIPTAAGDRPTQPGSQQTERPVPVPPALARRIDRLGGGDAAALRTIVEQSPSDGPARPAPRSKQPRPARPATGSKQPRPTPQTAIPEEAPSPLAGIAVAALDTSGGGLGGGWILVGLVLTTAAAVAVKLSGNRV